MIAPLYWLDAASRTVSRLVSELYAPNSEPASTTVEMICVSDTERSRCHCLGCSSTSPDMGGTFGLRCAKYSTRAARHPGWAFLSFLRTYETTSLDRQKGLSHGMVRYR
ncbi:MAG: PilT protein domain protein [Caudoviricetes sp.]|nr:MAG: PilT protein domain protein [Caudoviricetes sp.]